MEIIGQLIDALFSQDFETLATPSLLWSLYAILFVILFLEHSILPAAFLPGDSLLIFVGVLIGKGTMNFPLTICLLTVAASLGSWVSYMQGRWFGKSKKVQGWLAHIPEHYHQRAHKLLHEHGFASLFIARFLAFVRTLLPTIFGLSGLDQKRFQVFNWASALLWIVFLTCAGYMVEKTPLFRRFEEEVFFILLALPFVLLILGLIGSIMLVRKNRQKILNQKS